MTNFTLTCHPQVAIHPMLKRVLRGLVPVGAAALLALAPEVARADDECGVAMGGEATCGPTGMYGGNLPDGITYITDDPEGLMLTIEQREDGEGTKIAREIKSTAISTGELFGNGIVINSESDTGEIHLIVKGDTNLVRRVAPEGLNPGSRHGIFVSKAGSGEPVLDGVTIETGAGVDIGEEGKPFRNHGINADVAASGTFTGTNTAGIRITNAGKIYAREQGIRALGVGQKLATPSSADHLNGKIEITHSGTIEAGGWGIHTTSDGNADVAVTVETGGMVTGGGGGVFAETTGRAGPGGSGNIVITSAGTIEATGGKGIEVKASAGTNVTTIGVMVTAGTVESTDDTGIYTTSAASTGATSITVAEGASVTGATHGIQARHGSDTAAVNINIAGTVEGGDNTDEAAIKIDAGGAATPVTVTLTDGFRIDGDILFDGGEDDTLTMTVAENMRGEVMGKIAMVDDLVKNGKGTAWLGDDVTFAGSTAMINEGVLILRGHLDLGDGTLTVMDGARLAVEVGGADGDHGQVTAGTVTPSQDSAGFGEVFVTLDADEEEVARQQLQSGITIFLSDVPTDTNAKMLDTGMVVAKVRDDGSITQGGTVDPPPPDDNGNGNGGDDNGGNGGGNGGGSGGGGDDSGSGAETLLALGGGAVLAYLLWDVFDDDAALGWSEDEYARPGTAVHRFSSVPTGERSDATGLEYQVRLLGGDLPAAGMAAPVSAMSAAVRAHLGGGFHTELSATPKLAAEAGRDTLSGSRYALGLGWRSGVFSTDIGYSHAPLRARSTFSNVDGLGELSGSYALHHEQVRANAKLDLHAGGVSVSPSVSLFGGTVSQEGYTASSRVWLSEVPAVSQEYGGWKAGLALGARSGVKAMGLRWRPELRLTTTRLSGGDSGELQLVQRDRAGALRLHTPARASLPRTVHALGTGLTVAGGQDWSLRGGYVALLADNELQHAAGAQFRMRF